MYNYGCTWNSFEAKDRYLDTEQYALHAGGLGFDSPHLHHLIKHRIAPASSPGALHLTSHYLPRLFFQLFLGLHALGSSI